MNNKSDFNVTLDRYILKVKILVLEKGLSVMRKVLNTINVY